MEKSGCIVYNKTGGHLIVLLVKNAGSNKWGFPKGTMKKGEDAKEFAKKNFEQEVGVKIDFDGSEKHVRFGGGDCDRNYFVKKANRRFKLPINSNENILQSGWFLASFVDTDSEHFNSDVKSFVRGMKGIGCMSKLVRSF